MAAVVPVQVTVLPHGRGLELPSYATTGSAGCDLRAAVDEPVTLVPGGIARVPTGLCIALPLGFEAQVRPRSGLAARHGITVLNAPGTIDADYRGEVQVLLVNHGGEAVVLARGERIAQLVVAPYTQVTWQAVASLSDSPRGTGGFGSTGR